MNTIKSNIAKDFTIIPNALINDDTLSDRARFLFCYMAVKPDNWVFYQAPLAKSLNWSLDTLRKYLSELLESEWLSREIRREDGKFDSYDYTLHETPCGKKTDTVKNRDGKKPTRENSALNNKDLYKERLEIKKDDNSLSQSDDDENVFFAIDETNETPPPSSAPPPPQKITTETKLTDEEISSPFAFTIASDMMYNYLIENEGQLEMMKSQTRFTGNDEDLKGLIFKYFSDKADSNFVLRQPCARNNLGRIAIYMSNFKNFEGTKKTNNAPRPNRNEGISQSRRQIVEALLD